MNYNDISRRGLIKLNNDYDDMSDNSLLNFLNKSDGDYEEVRPVEKVIERVNEVSERFSDKSDAVSKSIMDRVNKGFDAVIKALEDEADRCESITDERNDDDSYSDDGEDDE